MKRLVLQEHDKRWLEKAPYVGWINWRDYGGTIWEILAPQGVAPTGSHFFPMRGFVDAEAIYDDICRMKLTYPILVVPRDGGLGVYFSPELQRTREENIATLRALLK